MCSVCQEQFVENEEVMSHDNLHEIHEICLRSLIDHGIFHCPICRFNITSINGEAIIMPVQQQIGPADPDDLSLDAIEEALNNDVPPSEDVIEQLRQAALAAIGINEEDLDEDGYIPNIRQ
jgi:hypothetical protein